MSNEEEFVNMCIDFGSDVNIIDEEKGYSLLDFALDSEKRVEKIFIVMGESKSAMYLTQKIRDNSSIDAIHPKEGDSFVLY